MENNQANIQLEMNFDIPSGNRFRRCLENGLFTVLFEHAAPGPELPEAEAARRFEKLEKAVLSCRELPASLAITDRCWSDNCRRAIDYAALINEKNRNSHLFYLSGRGLNMEGSAGLVAEAAGRNLANLVLVSGNSRSGESASTLRNMDFSESVEMIQFTRQYPSNGLFYPGAAVNPHLYGAPSLYAQLAKLIKKFNAGAEFAVTQAGFDMAQLDALQLYLSRRGYHQGLIARLMLLTPSWVEKLTSGTLPGVNISRDFLSILEKELRFSDSQFEAAQYRRLELQAAGCKLLGYNGIQIAGVDNPEKIHIALSRIAKALKEFTSLPQWLEEYKFYMARTDQARAEQDFYLYEKLLCCDDKNERDLSEFSLPEDSFRRRWGDRARRFFFPEADMQPAEERRWLKKLLAGCQSCEKCRLVQCQFHCPEKCPKGLLNGPCGGTRSNGKCEAGDFPCVHLDIWQSAHRRNECSTLEESIIPRKSEG